MHQLIIVFSALLAVTSAASVGFYAAAPTEIRALPHIYGAHSSSLVTPTQQQFHAQDELGQYSYGYSEPHSAKQEVRSLDGVTRGSYSYRDAEGKLQTVDYTADAAGFRVAATNLPRAAPAPAAPPALDAPVPVADTDAVAAARDAHLAAYQAAKLRMAKPESDSVAVDAADSTVELRGPVQDTVEVAAAKVEHLKRLEHEKQRNAALHQRGFVYHAATLPLAYHAGVIPSVYTYNYPLNSRFLASNYFY